MKITLETLLVHFNITLYVPTKAIGLMRRNLFMKMAHLEGKLVALLAYERNYSVLYA